MKNLILTALCAFVLFSCTNTTNETTTAVEEPEAPKVEEIKPIWELVSVVDKFGDETGEKVIAGMFDGVMRNSAGVDDDLQVKVQVKDSLTFIGNSN